MAVTLPSAFRQVPRNLTYKKECVPETVIASDSAAHEIVPHEQVSQFLL